MILAQGSPADLRRYASSEFSETARRCTNLFAPPAPVEVNHRRFDGKHIHRSARGELMMSKSEVLIANELLRRNVDYHYEKELRLGDRTFLPDLTIEDGATGLTVYWEHCGMLRNEAYREWWEKKKRHYRDHGILPAEEGGGANGTLVVTSDDAESGFDSVAVGAIIANLFGE